IEFIVFNFKFGHCNREYSAGLQSSASRVEGQFTSQGKLGLAFLAQIENLWYQVLIYSADKKTICQWTLKSESNFNVQSNYVHFMDDRGFSWSLLFDMEIQLIHFLALCLIAKSDNSKGAEKFSSIDLISGDEKVELNINNRDSLKCDCFEYLLTLRSEEETSIERNFNDFSLTWEQCLLNAKKSRKILFVEKTDENSKEKTFAVIVFHIRKIKTARTNSGEDGSKIEDNPDKRTNDGQKSQVPEASPISQKADLILKIAKIGHQITPFSSSMSTVDSTGPNNVTNDVPQQIQNRNSQPVPHCSYVCHCCHCAYYRNNIPSSEISTLRNDIQNLCAKFDQLFSNLEQIQGSPKSPEEITGLIQNR
uniref:Uncharacterized protein n=1 Tax=Romanomermis culicivorax TaxID=13658 RepID=A0A915JXR3_ROMCU